MIVLHHTASDSSPLGVCDWWISTSEKVGTPFIIAGDGNTAKKWVDGQIFQTCPSNSKIWHLGVKLKDLQRGGPKHIGSGALNFGSIGIEICNWGALVEKGQAFISYAGTKVPDNQIQEYKTAFRGNHHYQKYTDAQIESTRKLVLYLCDKYDIPKKWPGMPMFDICADALQGVPGIYSHVSVRTDKQDCHPQVELIQMLNSL